MSKTAGTEQAVCWVCGSRQWKLFKPSTLACDISSRDFQITDAHYGHTAEIDECLSCGFKQCVNLESVLGYYENLEDPAYDEGRAQRGLQARKILEAIVRHKKSGRLLDIGAASGILVEQGAKLGFDAVGIEPSRDLSRRAQQLGLNVHLGTFPHPEVTGPFDVITLVDVLEHVSTPVPLLRDIAAHLAPGGIGAVSTPNIESIAAKVLGRRWWHFRVAHIGYFGRKTLLRALDAAGLEPLHICSPPWYFPVKYAGDRALSYLPHAMQFKLPDFASRATLRINFHDSLQVIFKRKGEHAGK